MDVTGEEGIHSSKNNGCPFSPFLSLSPTPIPVFLSTNSQLPEYLRSIPHCIRRRDPKASKPWKLASHPVLVSLLKLPQCPAIGRTLAQLPYMAQTPFRSIRRDETDWQYPLTKETVIALSLAPSATEHDNGCLERLLINLHFWAESHYWIHHQQRSNQSRSQPYCPEVVTTD